MILKPVAPENGYAISQYCKYWFRCEQSSGEIANKVTGAATANKNAGYLDASLWANSGYATVGGGASNYCTVASSTHDVTLNGYSLICTLRLKKAAATFPAAEQYMVASYQPGSNNGGIIIASRTDGSIKMYVNTTDNTTVGVTSAANVITDGATATERSVVFVWPRNSGVSALVAVDGIISSSSPATTVAGKSAAGGRNLQIGAPYGGGSIDAVQIAAFGMYAVPLDLGSLDQNQIYDWAYRNPGVPMPDWVFA